MYKCKCCGWVGKDEEIPGKDFREDYGDVYLQYCPNCKQVDWDNGWLFEEVETEITSGGLTDD